jgi:hypothetical protein
MSRIISMEPFEKITKAEFELRGLESPRHAAHLQYKLMLLEPVLRVHVDFIKKTATITYDKPSKNTKLILDALKPVRATLKSKESMDYTDLLSSGYHEAF